MLNNYILRCIDSSDYKNLLRVLPEVFLPKVIVFLKEMLKYEGYAHL